MNALVKESSRHYGAKCRDYKLQKIYSDDIKGDMIFNRSRLFIGSILPQHGTTLITVYALQDITEMPWTLGYPYFDDDTMIAAYHAKFGPYTLDVFEEKFDKLFSAIARCGSDITSQFRKLVVIKKIYLMARECLFLVKEYSEQLLMLLYEDAFKYCDIFNDDYLSTHPRAELYKTETIFHIREFIDKIDGLFHEFPHLAYRMNHSLLDRFLKKKSYKHLKHGLTQFWIDPLRARVVAKHYDLYFKELWFGWMSRNFQLPDCIYLCIIDWLLFVRTNRFLGETMLSLLQRTHDETLGARDILFAPKFKRVTRDVTSRNGEFLDIINVEIFI